MREETIGYIVLITVLLSAIIGMAFVYLPQQTQFEPRATGPFTLQNQPTQTYVQPVQSREQPPIQSLRQSGCIPAEKEDNCPNTYNPDQKDSDNDGIGDACDPEYNPPKCCGCSKITDEGTQEIYGSIGINEAQCQAFTQSNCGPQGKMILTKDLSKCQETPRCEVTTQISQLPPREINFEQPLTGRTTKEINSTNTHKTLLWIALLLAVLAIVSYANRNRIKEYIKKISNKAQI